MLNALRSINVVVYLAVLWLLGIGLLIGAVLPGLVLIGLLNPAGTFDVVNTISNKLLIVAATFATGQWLILYYLPIKTKIKTIFGKQGLLEVTDLPEVTSLISRFSAKLQIQPPTLWLIHSPIINAYALGGGSKSAMVITTGLLSKIPPKGVIWVLAHEMAHLYHNDTRPRSLLKTGAQALAVQATFITWYLHGLAVLKRVYIVKHLVRFLSIVAIPIFHIIRHIRQVARGGFTITDKFLNRKIELRADRLAVELTSVSHAVEALEVLQENGDDYWSVLSSHPTPRERIKKITGP